MVPYGNPIAPMATLLPLRATLYNLFVCYLFVRMLAPLPRRLCSLLNEKV
jgi:hypothetical protein